MHAYIYVHEFAKPQRANNQKKKKKIANFSFWAMRPNCETKRAKTWVVGMGFQFDVRSKDFNFDF